LSQREREDLQSLIRIGQQLHRPGAILSGQITIDERCYELEICRRFDRMHLGSTDPESLNTLLTILMMDGLAVTFSWSARDV
jgi:hypothetical protein